MPRHALGFGAASLTTSSAGCNSLAQMRTTDLPTGTVTFVFTDIEGSTQLLKRLGKRYGEVLAEHRKILRTAAREHGGEEVDNQGDSFLFAFPRAEEAAAAAID